MKVDYKKHFSSNGTVYTQTITLSNYYASRFNSYIRKNCKILRDKNINYSLYLQYLTRYCTNYLTLTTLKLFKEFIDLYYPKLDKLQNRIKTNRNTIILIKEVE